MVVERERGGEGHEQSDGFYGIHSVCDHMTNDYEVARHLEEAMT